MILDLLNSQRQIELAIKDNGALLIAGVSVLKSFFSGKERVDAYDAAGLDRLTTLMKGLSDESLPQEFKTAQKDLQKVFKIFAQNKKQAEILRNLGAEKYIK